MYSQIEQEINNKIIEKITVLVAELRHSNSGDINVELLADMANDLKLMFKGDVSIEELITSQLNMTTFTGNVRPPNHVMDPGDFTTMVDDIHSRLAPGMSFSIPMSKSFSNALKIICSRNVIPDNKEKLAQGLETQTVVFNACLDLNYQIDTLEAAMYKLSRKFGLNHSDGQVARLLPRLLELLGKSEAHNNFTKEVTVRIDYLCVQSVAIRVVFRNVTEDNDLVQRIHDQYFDTANVEAFALSSSIDPDSSRPLIFSLQSLGQRFVPSAKRREYGRNVQSISFSIRSLVTDFLPNVTQADIDQMLKHKFCCLESKILKDINHILGRYTLTNSI